MDWTAYIRSELTSRAVTPDDDVVLELSQHAQAACEAAMAEGHAEPDAIARVRDLVEAWVADPTVAARRPRRAPVVVPPAITTTRRSPVGLWEDIVYGVRLMRRQRGSAIVSVLTIGLAVAATTTLVSVTYGVLARPLPWPDADRIIRVDETREGSTKAPMFLSDVTFGTWRPSATTIDALGAYSHSTVSLDAGAGLERLEGASMTASLFDVLRVVPLRGRAFTADDEQAGDVVIISHAMWTRRFGGDPGTVGRTVVVNTRPRTIVGVMPARFDFPSPATEIWLPMRVSLLTTRPGQVQTSVQLLTALARLTPHASPEAAAAEATAAGRAGPKLGLVGTAVFGGDGPVVVRVRRLQDMITSDVRAGLLLLLVGVGLLFITAITGLATLQVARAVARRREVAIRAAIGAGGARLARQVIIEQLVLGACGGALGLGMAWAIHRALPTLMPADFPRVTDIVLDWRLASVAALLAVAASLASALFPALQARRVHLLPALAEQSLAPIGGRLRSPALRLRAAMIVAQIGMTVVLLAGAALLVRSFVAMTAVDRGYDPANLLTARLPVATSSVPPPGRLDLVEGIVARLRAVPDVTEVGYGMSAPFMPGWSMLAFTLGAADSRTGQSQAVEGDLNIVSADFMRALGMRIVDGRGFLSTDGASSAPVAVVNAEFARRYLREPALGRRLPLGHLGLASADHAVIGVVADVAGSQVGEPPRPQVFLLSTQAGARASLDDVKLIVRTAGDPTALVPAVKTIARDAAADLPVESIVTMSDRLAGSLARPRLYAWLISGFAAIALLVAGVGLFGVLAHGVAARRRELGLRLALGATPADLVRLVVAQGLALSLPGLAIGVVLAWTGASYGAPLLYGVTPTDLATYVAVVAVLLLLVATASALTASRAATVDPSSAFKE